jgi:hypothetical protein
VVLLHPFGMSNFSVNFLYSVGRRVETESKTEEENKVRKRETVEEAVEVHKDIYGRPSF